MLLAIDVDRRERKQRVWNTFDRFRILSALQSHRLLLPFALINQAPSGWPAVRFARFVHFCALGAAQNRLQGIACGLS